MNDEKEALAQFLNIDTNDIQDGYSDHIYETDEGEYWVSDYDTAYYAAVEDCESLFDEMGLEAVTEETAEYFLGDEEFCSYPWEDDMHESNLNYAQAIDSESGYDGYATRLVAEAVENGCITDEDCFTNEDGELDYDDKYGLAEMLADELDSNYHSMDDWFDNMYGSSWISEMKDVLEDYMDYRACAKYCVDIDGIAHTLARYDGAENTENVNGETYFIYRID